jgi:hypothetical protein
MIRLRRYDYGYGTSVILRASTAARSLVLLCLRRASRVGRRRVSVWGRVMGASERGALYGYGYYVTVTCISAACDIAAPAAFSAALTLRCGDRSML